MVGSMRAGVYVRISLDVAGKGLGVQRQEQDCRAKATALGWDVAEVYTDNDVSASSGTTRPEYARMLADLEAGTIKAVVVYDLDRLTRRPVELEAFIDLADRKGIALANAQGETDLTNANGRGMARMKGVWARMEAERIGERVSRQKQQNREQGKRQGGRYRTYGYTRQWEVVPDEAPVVKEAFERRAAGESITAIATDFTARGFTNVNDKPWNAGNLGKLLEKPDYAGLLSYKGEIVGPTSFDSIIDVATYDAVRDKLAVASRKGQNARAHLLTGILTCSKCLTTMKGNAASNHYRCPSPKDVQGACGSCTAKKDEADYYVFNAAWRMQQKNISQWLFPRVESSDNLDDVIGGLETDLAAAEAAYDAGDILMVDLIPMVKSLRAKIAAASRERAKAVPYELSPVMATLIKWEEWNLSQKRLWIGQWVDYVLVHPPTQHNRLGFDPRRLEAFYTNGEMKRLTKHQGVDIDWSLPIAEWVVAGP